MNERLESIREFFRENPRMWIVAVGAVLIAGGVAWYVFRGTSVDLGKSNAQQSGGVCGDGVCDVTEDSTCPSDCGPGTGGGGGVVCSATFRSCQGTDVFQHYSNCNGAIIEQCASGCNPGNADNTAAFCIGSSTTPGITPKATPPTPPPPTPSGDCTKGADGLWYCKNLSCGLAGNGSNPPAGPASSIQVVQYRTVCDDVEGPNNPQVGCKIFMDATPKIGGQEGYPPRDPSWSCTNSMTIPETDGRYCYTPFGKTTVTGPVTCCANTGLPGDCVSFTVQPRSGGTTSPTASPAPALLKVSCSANAATLTWNIPARANSNAVQRMVPGGTWTWVLQDATGAQTSFVDSPLIAGAQWRVKSAPSVASNVVSCAGPVSTPISGIPPAQGDPVECFPARQSVSLNETAHLQAQGGTNVFTWNVTQGGAIQEGGNEYIGVSYRTSGLKTLRVSSGGTSATCTIDVAGSIAGGSPTPTPSSTVAPGQASLVVEKTAQNTTTGDPVERSAVTVFPGQTVQFRVRITNVGSAPAIGVSAEDTLPAGMSFVPDSTTLNGQTVSDDSIIFGGLTVGTVAPGASTIVEWSAVADQAATLASGPNRSTPEVVVTTDNTDTGGTDKTRAQMPVVVYGAGSSAGAGEVPTGPGGAVIVALMTAAALTLLYSGYTRSPTYRRREAEDVSEDPGPLDFRS